MKQYNLQDKETDGFELTSCNRLYQIRPLCEVVHSNMGGGTFPEN